MRQRTKGRQIEFHATLGNGSSRRRYSQLYQTIYKTVHVTQVKTRITLLPNLI